MKRASVGPFDFILFGATVCLMGIGIAFIYSSGVNASGILTSREFIRQVIWAVSGIAVLLTFTFLNYATLRMLSFYIYLGGILLLLITLLFGREVNGARSWLGFRDIGIQPSEFAKIATILFLATYLAGIGNGVREAPRFLLGLLIVMVPFALILAQPDMGTALVLLPIFLCMSLVAGADVRHLAYISGLGVLMVAMAAVPSLMARSGHQGVTFLSLFAEPDLLRYILPAAAAVTGLAFMGWRWLRRTYFFWIFYAASMYVLAALGSLVLRAALRDYQIMRLVIFVDPLLDPRGAGWNIIQSVTAIGSGGLVGKGFLRGTQSHYQFLPQQSTDFIFSILAEEWGFLGGLLVIGLIVVILLRGMSIVWGSRDDYAMLAGSGILAMIFFHAVVNIGMAMGIMPVTGIPLFFLSYGGSSLWTGLCGIGILMSVYRRRFRH